MPESEEEIDGREKIEFSSPSRLKRLLAFGMDFVLLTLCSTLLLFYIPKFHGEEAIIESVSYTHLRAPRDQRGSRMPSSA